MTALDPGRVRFPDHPDDIGEALGWLAGHVADYGGDPTRLLLIGHSAGAHLVDLVSTDPRYAEAYGVEPYQLIGTVSLDTDAIDVADRIAGGGPQARALFYNAFASPAENGAPATWQAASPLTWADPGDPRLLLVTQAASVDRLADNRGFATALGQDPGAVFAAPYDHEGINDAVGAAADPAGETAMIMAFLSERVSRSVAPRRPKLAERPAKRLRIAARRVRVRFRFRAPGTAGFECRIDRGRFVGCSSPRRYRVGEGTHRFRVRALSATGRPGSVRRFDFEVIRRP